MLNLFDDSASDSDTISATGNKRKADDSLEILKSGKTGSTEPEVEILKTKKAKHVKPFSEDLLLGPHGLDKIYNEFPLRCKYQGRGTELKFLKKMLGVYKEWAFQLHPGMSFPDVVSKCSNLASKGRIRSHMQDMRDRERDRYVVSTSERFYCQQ
jgi:hypothetical protein